MFIAMPQEELLNQRSLELKKSQFSRWALVEKLKNPASVGW